jgi:hypothetical protein
MYPSITKIIISRKDVQKNPFRGAASLENCMLMLQKNKNKNKNPCTSTSGLYPKVVKAGSQTYLYTHVQIQIVKGWKETSVGAQTCNPSYSGGRDHQGDQKDCPGSSGK